MSLQQVFLFLSLLSVARKQVLMLRQAMLLSLSPTLFVGKMMTSHSLTQQSLLMQHQHPCLVLVLVVVVVESSATDPECFCCS